MAQRLNMGVSMTTQGELVSPEDWREFLGRGNQGVRPEDMAGSVWGVDLGSGSSLSSACAVSPQGWVDSFTHVAVGPDGSLAERDHADGAEGALVAGGEEGSCAAVSSWHPSAHDLLRECLAKWGRPAALAADRWRLNELRDAAAATVGESVPLIPRANGWKDGAEDVRGFHAALPSLAAALPAALLTWAVSGARVIADQSGNARMAKKAEGGRRALHRDDPAAAMILAVGAWHRERERTELAGQWANPAKVYIA